MDEEQKEAWDRFYGSQPRPWKGVTATVTEFPFGKGDKVIDIGCGNGKTSLALAEAGCDVTGIDFSQAAADACASLCGTVKVICASADSLPLDDGTMDGAVMIHVLEHLSLEETKDAVREVRRVVRPYGKVFVRVFHKNDMRSSKGETSDDGTVIRGNGIRYRYFTEDELASLFSGFVKISTERIDEVTRFKKIRSRIEAIFERTP